MKKKCDKNYLNNSFFGNEFYDLYFRVISTKSIWVEKLAASSEIRKEELVSKTTAFAILMLNFVEKKERKSSFIEL